MLPFTIWSPLLDTAHQVTIPSPTTSETVITAPMIPGLDKVRHSRVSSRVQFFSYDPDDLGWYPYGMGTVTATSVVPDPTTRIYGFTGVSFNDGTPTPPVGAASRGLPVR